MSAGGNPVTWVVIHKDASKCGIGWRAGFSSYKEARRWAGYVGELEILPVWEGLSDSAQEQARAILLESVSYEQATEEQLESAVREWGHRYGSITPGDA